MVWRDAARGRTAECEMNPKGFLGRSMDFCLRIESGACERTPSGRGPREWSIRKSSSRLGCVPSGGFLADPCLLAARWHEFLSMQIQRSGHGGPRSRDPLSGPWPRWSLVEDPVGVPIQDCCLTSGTGVCTGLPYGGLGRASSPPFVFRPLSFDRKFELSTTSHDGRLQADFSVRRQISGLSATPTPRAVHWAR